MDAWKSTLRRGLAALGFGALAACSTVYTSPSVSTGSVFGGVGTDLKINVVNLTFESTTKANLTPYVPARLPLGFQPDAVKKMLDQTIDTDFDTAISPPATVSVNVPDMRPLPVTASRPGARPGRIANRLPPAGAPEAYRIGIADVLLISAETGTATVEQLPALISAQSKRQGFVVQDDGAIAIPDAGRVRVAGLTMQDAEAVIFQALVGAGIDPSFTFEISEFNSQRVSVSGEVREPALVPITLKPLYLHEALSTAGGVAVSDPRLSKIQLFRGGQTYQISVDRFRRDGRLRNVILEDGDSIFVTSDFNEDTARSRFQEELSLRQAAQSEAALRLQALVAQSTAQSNAVAQAAFDVSQVNLEIAVANLKLSVANHEMAKLEFERDTFQARLETGAVKRDFAYLAGEAIVQRRVELPFEQTANLADVLFGERGLNINFSDYGEIYVLRRPTNPEEAGLVHAYHLDATNAVNLTLAEMFQIHAGDVVFVAEQPVTAWNRALTQTLPSILLSAANVATGL